MDGQVLMDLEVNPFRLNCKGDVEFISKLKQISLNNLSDQYYQYIIYSYIYIFFFIYTI